MKLSEILKKIKISKNYRKQLTSIKKGIDFEKNLLDEILKSGEYFLVDIKKFKEHKSFKEIKDLIQGEGIVNYIIKTNLFEDFGNEPMVVYQPFGSQQSPDFLLIRNGFVLPLESKFTNKKVKAPTWNSGLPKLHFFYIFGSLGLQDISFSKGNLILNDIERQKILDLIEKRRRNLKEIGGKISNSFDIYLRPMYNQKNNWWKNEKRDEEEDSIIRMVENFEKE